MSKIKDLVPDMRLSVEEYYANLFNGDNNEFVKMFEKKNKTAYIMKSDTIENLEDSPYLETTQKTKELFERLKMFWNLCLERLCRIVHFHNNIGSLHLDTLPHQL